MLVSKSPRHRHYSVALLVNALCFILLLLLTLWLLRGHLPALKAQPSSIHFVSAPSPNYRPMRSRHIDTIVLHYTSGINVDPRHWADPRVSLNIFKRYHVSAHYLVDRAGIIFQLVQEHNVAWHAGGSIMPAPDNRHNVNSFSIGIETIATAHSGFTDAQYRSLVYLIRGIEQRYPIRHLVGHDEIAGTRAVRMGLRRDLKEDPGPLFDWGRLRGLLHEGE